jgi:hypothetical protein
MGSMATLKRGLGTFKREWTHLPLQVSAAVALLKSCRDLLRTSLSCPPATQLDLGIANKRLRIARAVAKPLYLCVHWSSVRSALARIHGEVGNLGFYEGSTRSTPSAAQVVDGIDNWLVEDRTTLRNAVVRYSLRGLAERISNNVAVALNVYPGASRGGSRARKEFDPSAVVRAPVGPSVSRPERRHPRTVLRGAVRSLVFRLKEQGSYAGLRSVITKLQSSADHEILPSSIAKFKETSTSGQSGKTSVFDVRLRDGQRISLRYNALNQMVHRLAKDYETKKPGRSP